MFYLYFDKNGVLQECVQEEGLRVGSSNINGLAVYCELFDDEDLELNDIWYLQEKPDGTKLNEISFIDNILESTIPYDKEKDYKYFKDYKTYKFYYVEFDSNNLDTEGLQLATVRLNFGDTLKALGEITFNVENNVIKTDNNITQSQYDYLITLLKARNKYIESLKTKINVNGDNVEVQGDISVNNKIETSSEKTEIIHDNNTVSIDSTSITANVVSGSEIKSSVKLNSSGVNIEGNTINLNGTIPNANINRADIANLAVDTIKPLENQVKITDGSASIVLDNSGAVNINGISSSPAFNVSIDGTSLYNVILETIQKGVAGGVATLDSTGKVPSSQLPSYVDDVLEYSSKSQFPTTGESGKIYIATDTNLTYRWSGSTYVEISQSLALGETSSTAYPGDKGKTAYDTANSALSKANSANTTANSALAKVNTNESNITKKQDKLTAGSNITIENNVISAAGTADAVLKNSTSTPQTINGSIVINADSHAYNEGLRVNGINGIGNFVISKESGNNNNILALVAENSFNDKKLVVVNNGTRYDIFIPNANGTLALTKQIPKVGSYYILLSINQTSSPKDWNIYIGIFAPNADVWNYDGEDGLEGFCEDLDGFYMPAFGHTNIGYLINYIMPYYSDENDYGFYVYYTLNGTITYQRVNLSGDSVSRTHW